MARSGVSTNTKKMLTDLSSLLLVFLGLLFLISLLSFSQADPSLNHSVSGNAEIENWTGLIGAYLSGLMADILGISSYIIALGVLGLGLSRAMPSFELGWWRWLGLLVLALCISAAGSQGDISIGEIRGGGVLGTLVSSYAVRLFSVPGAVLTWIFLILACSYLITGLSWFALVKKLIPKKYKGGQEGSRSRSYSVTAKPGQKNKGNAPVAGHGQNPLMAFTGRLKGLFARIWPGSGELESDSAAGRKAAPRALNANRKLAITAAYRGVESLESTHDDGMALDDALEDAAEPVEAKSASGKTLPPITLLTELEVDRNVQKSEELEARGRDLMDCLADFGIQGKLQDIVPGPVVTMFEIKPAPGVKVSRIASLGDDIALAMRAIAVRVQAPIPGTDAVGIEIPNEKREMVSFREVMASSAYNEAGSLLTMALGKDTTGAPAVADLAKMPHLLVAGATGAGKSVCLNSILLSLIFKAAPDELKLLLIDPKRIELAVYADLPHLVHPVVTEMVQAKSALDWAVHEMDRRYEAIAQLGVRNLAGYNEKLAELAATQPETVEGLEPMPYLVIVIDELADLMLTAGKEVEVAIVRLAQLARAAGIHLIIATQRPSVDVVTGLIKANFPCRISFQVTSKHDSRTILDTVGAEHLLGKGDMLIKPGGGRMQRLHGAFVPDADVAASVGFWKKLFPPRYDVDLNDWGTPDNDGLGVGSGAGGAGDTVDDPLYGQAVQFVMEQGKASISLIQRRFRIGFNKAARFVEQMEQDGIIGPADGSRPRQIIK